MFSLRLFEIYYNHIFGLKNLLFAHALPTHNHSVDQNTILKP